MFQIAYDYDIYLPLTASHALLDQARQRWHKCAKVCLFLLFFYLYLFLFFDLLVVVVGCGGVVVVDLSTFFHFNVNLITEIKLHGYSSSLVQFSTFPSILLGSHPCSSQRRNFRRPSDRSSEEHSKARHYRC